MVDILSLIDSNDEFNCYYFRYSFKFGGAFGGF